MKSGLRVSGVRRRYMVKQPGKQVIEPNSDSNALARWCEMKYSYTCDMVTIDCLALEMEVSPQMPIIFLSCMHAETRRLSDSSWTVVSASTMNRYS